MQEKRSMKMNNFKKRYNHATAVKVKPTIELKTVNTKNQEKKVEEVRVLDLTSTVGHSKDQIV